MDNQKSSWEDSYRRKDNFVFYPHEEVIRFFSKYINRRVGIESFEKKHSIEGKPKLLDLGCGIGRHVIFGDTMQTDSYGIDLSESAISIARDWALKSGLKNVENRILQGDITAMPFSDCFFDFIVSHGVLDSMSMKNAIASVKEANRVLKPGGYFYCDLISGDDSYHSAEFSGEEIVSTEHEKGTIQLYFNSETIEDLFANEFDRKEVILVRRTNVSNDQFISRYHIVLQKKP